MTKAIVVKAPTAQTREAARAKQPHKSFNPPKGLGRLKNLPAWAVKHGAVKP